MGFFPDLAWIPFDSHLHHRSGAVGGLPENSGFHRLLTHRPPHRLNPEMMMMRKTIVMAIIQQINFPNYLFEVIQEEV